MELPGNTDPAYTFRQDPTEIVKAAILSCFDDGSKWSVRQVVPHYAAPDMPGYKILLAVEWYTSDEATGRAVKTQENVEVQVTRMKSGPR